MKRVFDVLSGLIVFAAALWFAFAAVPLSWGWFAPRAIYVSSGAPSTIRIDFQRDIFHQIDMKYTVTIRNVRTQAVACQATAGPFTYRPDAQLPDDVTLQWWAPSDARCAALPPGEYVMQTCWTAALGVLPDKTVCIDSNVFRVD